MSLAYPKTRLLSADLLKTGGCVPFGCKISGGRIIPALSVVGEGVNCPENVAFAAYSEAAQAFFITAGGKLYRAYAGGAFYELAQFTADAPFIAEERGKTYIFGDSALTEYADGNFRTVLQSFGVRGGCLKNARIFAADVSDGNKLRWSGAGGAEDWTKGIDGAGWAYPGGGYGKILKTVVLRDKLVAVREYGLTVMSAFGAPEDFKVEGGAATRAVNAKTAVKVGGTLVFFAGDGLYNFDGTTVSEMTCVKRFGLSEPVCAAAFGNRYFISGYSRSCGKNAVLALNPDNEEAYIIDAEAEALAAAGGKLYAFCGGKMRVISGGGAFAFVCGSCDFGTRKVKRLLRLEISALEPVTVEIDNGRTVKRFTGATGVIRPRISGTDFKITVRSSAEVASVRAYAEAFSGN